MKKLLTLLTCLFILSPNVVLSETVKFKNLVERNGLYYKKSSDGPFSGEVTGKEQGVLKNGKKNGPWVWYHENRHVWEERTETYKNGKKISD